MSPLAADAVCAAGAGAGITAGAAGFAAPIFGFAEAIVPFGFGEVGGGSILARIAGVDVASTIISGAALMTVNAVEVVVVATISRSDESNDCRIEFHDLPSAAGIA